MEQLAVLFSLVNIWLGIVIRILIFKYCVEDSKDFPSRWIFFPVIFLPDFC